MFEVGKKYVRTIEDGVETTLECIGAGKKLAILVEPETQTESFAFQKDFHLYKEYVEPIRQVWYYNVYRGTTLQGETKLYLGTDQRSYPMVRAGVGRVRVELVEGKYDD